MDLLEYGMSGDTNGGVCLKIKLDYNTYEKSASGCTDIEIIEHIVEYLNTGMYILPYVNINPNYTGGTEYNLTINESMNDWFSNYVVSLSTGATELEYRTIYSEYDNEFYKIDYYSDYCEIDSISRWAISEVISEYDSCGNITNNASIKLEDINPNSKTFGDINTVEKIETSSFNNISLSIISIVPVSTSSIKITGETVNDSGYQITKAGFCYSRDRDPDLSDSVIELDLTSISTGITISNLSEEEYYYIKIFAENELGIVYSDSKIIKTLGVGDFNVLTSSPLNPGIKKLDISGTVENPTYVKIKSVGLCWNTGLTDPTINSNNISAIYTGDTFQLTASNLINGTYYNFRTYVITKSFGVIYGNVNNSLAGGKPILDGISIVNNNIGQIYAEVESIILDTGWPSDIIEAGFCYGTSSGVTSGLTNTTLIVDPINNFKTVIHGLINNTNYYIKAYATNDLSNINNLGYSNEITFKTLDITAPILNNITTEQISNSEINASSSVFSSGGTSITEYGVCWNNAYEHPEDVTLDNCDSKRNEISEIGVNEDFTFAITGLTSDTLYNIRAYAINSKGTGYTENVTEYTYGNITLYISSDTYIELTLTRFNDEYETHNGYSFTLENIDFNKDFAIYARGNVDPDQVLHVYQNGYEYTFYKFEESRETDSDITLTLNTGDIYHTEYYIDISTSYY